MRNFIFSGSALFGMILIFVVIGVIQITIQWGIDSSQIVYAGYCIPVSLEKTNDRRANIRLNLRYAENKTAYTTEPDVILHFVRNPADSIFAEVKADGEALCRISK